MPIICTIFVIYNNEVYYRVVTPIWYFEWLVEGGEVDPSIPNNLQYILHIPPTSWYIAVDVKNWLGEALDPSLRGSLQYLRHILRQAVLSSRHIHLIYYGRDDEMIGIDPSLLSSIFNISTHTYWNAGLLSRFIHWVVGTLSRYAIVT